MYPFIMPAIGLPLAYLLSIVVTEVTKKGLAKNPFWSAGANGQMTTVASPEGGLKSLGKLSLAYI